MLDVKQFADVMGTISAWSGLVATAANIATLWLAPTGVGAAIAKAVGLAASTVSMVTGGLSFVATGFGYGWRSPELFESLGGLGIGLLFGGSGLMVQKAHRSLFPRGPVGDAMAVAERRVGETIYEGTRGLVGWATDLLG